MKCSHEIVFTFISVTIFRLTENVILLESNIVINGNQIRGDRLNRYSIPEVALDLCRSNWFLDFSIRSHLYRHPF